MNRNQTALLIAGKKGTYDCARAEAQAVGRCMDRTDGEMARCRSNIDAYTAQLQRIRDGDSPLPGGEQDRDRLEADLDDFKHELENLQRVARVQLSLYVKANDKWRKAGIEINAALAGWRRKWPRTPTPYASVDLDPVRQATTSPN